MKRLVITVLLGFAVCGGYAREESESSPTRAARILGTVDTATPRQTMASFMGAMNAYKQSVEEKNLQVQQRALDEAIRTLNTGPNDSILTGLQSAREAAIFLKEVIDRVAVVDYEGIPDVPAGGEKAVEIWRFAHTEITIGLVKEGERKGQYLFTPQTVERAPYFYSAVKDEPYLEGSDGGAGYQASWLEQQLPDWADDKILGYHYWQWLGILLAIFFGLFVRMLVRIGARVLSRLAAKTQTSWDDDIILSLVGPAALFANTLVWMALLPLLRFEGVVQTILSKTLEILLFVAITWGFYKLAAMAGQHLSKVAKRGDNRLDAQLAELASRTLKIFVVVLGVLLGAQNIGINVFSLLAGLGIGGLAVALAAKDTLANFFGSIMIMLDRPFRIGHWIKVGDSDGEVEHIGFRSTRIRTFYNSLISVPNMNLATETVDNMGMRHYRRVKTTVGVTYDTPPDKLEAFLEGIKQIILANPHTRKDYFHVVFNDFGNSSLDILLYFFLKVPDWSRELVERQNVLLEIVRLADELGVSFAFPSTSLYVESTPEHPLKPHRRLSHQELQAKAEDFGKTGEQSRPAGTGIFKPPYTDPKSKHFRGSEAADGSDGD